MEFISSEIEVSRTTISGKRFVIILSIILKVTSHMNFLGDLVSK